MCIGRNGGGGDPAKLAELYEKLSRSMPQGQPPAEGGSDSPQAHHDPHAAREETRRQHDERMKQRREEAKERKRAKREQTEGEL